MSYADESRHKALIEEFSTLTSAIDDESSSREKIWVEFACAFLHSVDRGGQPTDRWFDTSAKYADEMLKRFDMRFRHEIPEEDEDIPHTYHPYVHLDTGSELEIVGAYNPNLHRRRS